MSERNEREVHFGLCLPADEISSSGKLRVSCLI